GKDLDEGAEVDDSVHRTEIGLAHLSLRRQTANTIDCRIRCFTTRRRDRDRTVVRYVDLCASLFNQGSDDFAAWSNDVADLVGIDSDLDDSRSVRGNLFARRSKRLFHCAENVYPAFLRLLEGFSHDLRVDAGDLDVHLKRRDSVACSSDLEIHVAVVIFGAGNVS